MAVQVSDPTYGPQLDPREGEVTDVRVDVEPVRWEPLAPSPCDVPELVFVDGVQQVEAWLNVTPQDDPAPVFGVAFAVGAGAVVADGARARVEEVAVQRVVLTEGGRCLHLPAQGGFAWDVRAGGGGDPGAMAARVAGFRRDLEQAIAERMSAGHRLVVLDGRLSFLRETRHPVIGVVKSHHAMYLQGEHAGVVTALRAGQRTPLFAIGDDRFGWYQRLPNVGDAGWAGRRARRGVAGVWAGHRPGPGRPGGLHATALRRAAPSRRPRAAEHAAHHGPRAAPACTGWATAAWRSAPCAWRARRPRWTTPRPAARRCGWWRERPRHPARGGAGAPGWRSQSFQVGIADDRSVQVDDLVAVTIRDPGGDVTTFGIVTETYAQIEGTSLPSDTVHFSQGTLPGELVRTADVQVVRVDPERWIAPHPGSDVRAARGAERAKALYEDTMRRTLALGLGRDGQPIRLDLDFLDGTKGGHVSISGISGVATKTSTALALVRLLLEHPEMRRRVRVLIFNVKGEDLLHIDRDNATYAARDDRGALDDRWARWAWPTPAGSPTWDSGRRPARTPPACPTASRAWRTSACSAGRPGGSSWRASCGSASRTPPTCARSCRSWRSACAASCCAGPCPCRGGRAPWGSCPPPSRATRGLPRGADAQRAGLAPHRGPRRPRRLAGGAADRRGVGPGGPGAAVAGHRRARHRQRVHAPPRVGRGRLRGLVRADAMPIPRGDAAQNEPPVAVVHLTRLHEFAQRFVVGTLLAQTFAAKESGKRDPIEFVVLDELNKYAPREGSSPIKDTLIDIAQRGRSLGVILVGAQQQASLVAPEVTQNAAVRISGRLDPAEAERSEYGWLSPAARARARLLMQGRVMVSQPSVPAPLTVEIPVPAVGDDGGRGGRRREGRRGVREVRLSPRRRA